WRGRIDTAAATSWMTAYVRFLQPTERDQVDSESVSKVLVAVSRQGHQRSPNGDKKGSEDNARRGAELQPLAVRSLVACGRLARPFSSWRFQSKAYRATVTAQGTTS